MYLAKLLGSQGMVNAAVLIVLLISAITDARHRTLPIVMYPLLVLVGLYLQRGVFSGDPAPYLMTGIVFALLFLLQALFFGGGGGDVILMAVMGLLYGLVPMLIMVFATATATVLWYAVRSIVRREHTCLRTTYPYVPFFLVGFITYLIAGRL